MDRVFRCIRTLQLTLRKAEILIERSSNFYIYIYIYIYIYSASTKIFSIALLSKCGLQLLEEPWYIID